MYCIDVGAVRILGMWRGGLGYALVRQLHSNILSVVRKIVPLSIVTRARS